MFNARHDYQFQLMSACFLHGIGMHGSRVRADEMMIVELGVFLLVLHVFCSRSLTSKCTYERDSRNRAIKY